MSTSELLDKLQDIVYELNEWARTYNLKFHPNVKFVANRLSYLLFNDMECPCDSMRVCPCLRGQLEAKNNGNCKCTLFITRDYFKRFNMSGFTDFGSDEIKEKVIVLLLKDNK